MDHTLTLGELDLSVAFGIGVALLFCTVGMAGFAGHALDEQG